MDLTGEQPPIVDVGNKLLDAQTCQLRTATVPTSAGTAVVVTIRTPSATLTVFLDKAAGIEWGDQIKNEAAGISESGLITGNGRRV